MALIDNDPFEPASMHQPLLTLAIPTYNRAEKLKILIESVLADLLPEGRIELIISDNNSTDETAAALESFRARGLVFRYIRNDTNIGADKNFLQCFNEARGKYVWLVGDDDVIVRGGIAQLLSLLQQADEEPAGEFDLVYLSAFSFSGNDGADTPRSRRYGFASFAEVVTDAAYFLHRVHGLVGFISSIAVNKSRLCEREKLAVDDYAGSNLAHLSWILPSLRESCRILFVSEPLVGFRSDNASGWAPCRVFGLNLRRLAIHQFGVSSALTHALLNGVLRFWLPRTILNMRLGRHPNLQQEDCAGLLKPAFKNNWRFWFFVYPAAVFPLRLARMTLTVLDFINKAERSGRVFYRHLFGSVQRLSPL